MAARLVLLGLWFLPWLMLGQAGDAQGEKAPVPHGLYRPIALALIGEGKRLVVANRDGGSLVLLDTDQRKILAETRVGKKLSDVAVTADGKRVYVTDEDTGELIVTAIVGDKFEVLRRQPVGTSPVSVRLGDQGGVVTVALLWPRRVLILREGLAPQPRPVSPEGREEKIDLPFAPRLQVPVPGTTKLIVADAFAGKLAVVDLERRKLDSVRNLPVHNVRGLALDAKQKSLLISHQMINAFGRTTKGEIQTSNLVTNHVRRLSLAALLDPRGDITREERLYQLGGIDEGAGDPAELHELGDGRLLVALAGVHEFAVGRPEEVLWTRLPVGRRPIAFAVDAARQRAYVANMFSDSISIVDLQAVRLAGGIPLAAATPKLTSLARGEMLFFDASLSFESWFSCHSCHSDGHSNGRLNDNLSDGSFGTPKRVLSLLGAKDTGPWAWNASMPDLEAQVRSSAKSTMQGKGLKDDEVRDLAAFLRTLTPPPSLLQARGTVDEEAFKRGRKVFSQQKCATCHAPPIYTSAKTFDVGIHDELGGKHFNPPSLRGVSQGGPYFHDNRAASLEEVFGRYRHQLSGALSSQELRDLLHFLGSL